MLVLILFQFLINKFKELYYTLKCKKRLRYFYYEKLLKPKIECKCHPDNFDNLIQLLEGTNDFEDFESIIEDW